MKRYITLICLLSCLSLLLPSYAYGAANSTRIYSGDIYSTSVNVAETYWNNSKNVILVSANGGNSSLFAPELSKYYNAPIVFLKNGEISSDAQKLLKKLNVKNAYLLGFDNSGYSSIAKKLRDYDIDSENIYGKDIIELSVKVANHVADNFGKSQKAIIASADNKEDIFSACMVGALRRIPVLLTNKKAMPEETKKFIENNKISKLYVMGGTDVIGDYISSPSYGIERILGSDGHKRQIMLYKEFENYINFSNVYAAPAKDYSYALAGSAAALYENSPLFIIDGDFSKTFTDFIQADGIDVSKVTAIGPEGLVSDSLTSEITKESRSTSDIAEQKDYTEFSNNILHGFYIKASDGSKINIDRVAVGQKADDESYIYIYLDIYSKDFGKYLNGENAKAGIEKMMGSIVKAAEAKYPGKTIGCELYHIESFDEYPVSQENSDIQYDISTGKWNIMSKEVEAKSGMEGKAVFTWAE